MTHYACENGVTGGSVQYANLGNSGLIVSCLAFGAMTFSVGNKDMAATT